MKKSIFLSLLFGIGSIVVIYEGCGFVQRPRVGNLPSLQFSHAGVTSNCASCHGTGSSFAAFPVTGHPPTTNQDCSSCHLTSSWLTANPHVAGAPLPPTCKNCHADKLPLGPQGTMGLLNNLTPTGGLFDHLTEPAGAGDCYGCHTAVPQNVGVSWSGGVFSHSPTPTACLSCHTSVQKPVGLVGPSPGFDHVTDLGRDCAACHLSVPANVGRTWAQAGYGHTPVPTTCANCHLSDATYIAIQNTIKYQMNHQYPGLPDCATCHLTVSQTSGFTSWSAGEAIANGSFTALATQGVFHANVGTTPTACQSCHINERPPGPVGAKLFDHANGGSGECATCHKTNIGFNWAGATFNHTNGGVPITTGCASCHQADLPTPGVPVGYATVAGSPTVTGLPATTNTKDGFTHKSQGSYVYLNACENCHLAVTANNYKSWTGAYFDHNGNNGPSLFNPASRDTPPNCRICHETKEGSNHKLGENCWNCHATSGTPFIITWPRPSSTGQFGGKWKQ